MGDEYQNRRDIDKIYDDLYSQINGSLNVLKFKENSPYRNISSKDGDIGTIDAIIDYYGLTERSGGGGDLSNYYTKSEIDGILSSYVTSDFANTHYAPLVHTHSEYITRAEIHQLDIDLSTLELVPKSTNPNGVICFDNLGENLYIKKSNTSGLVKNDGSIDTTHYLSTLPSHNHDGRYYTETEVDTALTGKQDSLVSGTNIKTINNESLLGSGNINIQGGGGSVIGTGSFSINNQGHLIVELPNAVDNPYFIDNNGHLIYDTSNTYNGS